MSQRPSGYQRRPDEEYPTPDWVARIIALYLSRQLRPRGRLLTVWEPAAGHSALSESLNPYFRVLPTRNNFFDYDQPAHDSVDAIVTNPPYGDDKRGKLACNFIRHALSFDMVQAVAMLLRVDFDSAKTRVDLFRDNRRFAEKIVLLDRIKWFAGPSSPSDNHAWFVWRRGHRGPARLSYVSREM